MEPCILDRWDAVHARAGRWRWWIRLAMAVILLPPFWHFAHTRMTTPPADLNAMASFGTAPQPDPAGGLLAAIGKIPAPPPLSAPPPAPAGKHWVPNKGAQDATLPLPSIEYMVGSYGPWTPETRHHLRAIVEYFEAPAMQAALDEIAEQAVATVLPADYYNISQYGPVRQVVKLFAVQTRYQLVHRHDTAAASRDIGTILDLCGMLERGGTLMQHLVAIACRGVIYEEVISLSRENGLSRSQAQDLLGPLRSHRVDVPALWRGMNRGECRYALRTLDATYTKGPDGNGWFVPYGSTGSLGDRALSTLNLLSPAINDRLTLTRKIEFAADKAIRAADLPFQQAMDVLGRDTDRRQQTPFPMIGNPADGLGGMALSLSYGRLYTLLICCAVQEAAAIASLGLSAYQTEHGQYPAHLSELVPEYLPSLPMDAVTGEPLRYRLDDRDGYSLYSPGEDGVDSGGPLRDARGKLYEFDKQPDWAYVGLGRGEFEYGAEWTLVPDDMEAPSATGQP